MSDRRRKHLFRQLCLLLVCWLSVQPVAAVAGVSARMAERNLLRGLGLLDAVICHGDPVAKTGQGPRSSEEQPGGTPGQSLSCACCLTGCGPAGSGLPPVARTAIHRPPAPSLPAEGSAYDPGLVRAFTDERVHAPRSPPAPRT